MFFKTKNNFIPLVCFRKWSNKSYSVFSSLRIVIKICTLAIGYIILAKPHATLAQNDSIPISVNADIEEVEISKTKMSTTFSELMRAVVVITRDELEHLPATSLNELMENLASVDIRQRGGHGIQADIIIRGGSFDQVLILLNGINITDPQTGHHNLNIPLDLESIERIELLQGPGTRVYGPGSFSGAINIITSNKGNTFAKIGVLAGQHGLLKSNASTSLSGKNTNFFLAASSAKSDGYVENTDFNIHNLFAHTTFEQSSNIFDIQFGYQDKAFGAQSFYTPKFPEQFEKTSTFFGSASYTKKISGISITPSVYLRNHNDRFELFRYQSPDWYKGHNYHFTRVLGSKLHIVSVSPIGRTRAGAEYRNELILSNVLGDPLATPRIIQSFSDTTYTHGKSRELVNLFADHTVYLNRIIISAGGLMARSTNFGTHWNYGIDINLKLIENISLFSSINSAIRFPTFTDLYYNGPTNKGNIDLKPESANNYEVGLKISGTVINSNVTLFHRKGKDVIDWVKQRTDEQWVTMNHIRINSTGIECFAKINFYQYIPIIRNISVGYLYMKSNKNSGDLLSYYALDYLKQKATLSIYHTLYKNLYFSWTATWQDRAGTYTEYPLNIEKYYKPFMVINLRTSYANNRFNGFVDIGNVGNAMYFDLGNISQPGRWISVGINYKIE